jgi:hypothetical protein
MNDWWNYLVHSEVGGERKNHKYYARVVVGTDKHGRVQYRYFYDAREYGAYKTRKQNADKNHKIFSEDPKELKKVKGRTNIITGWGNTGLPNSSDLKKIKDYKPSKMNGKTSTLKNGVHGFDETFTFSDGTQYRTSMRAVSVKTVKNKKSKKNGKSIYQRGKDVVSKLFHSETKITMLRDMDGKSTRKYVSGKKKGKSFISSLFSDNPKITMLKDMDGKSVKKYIAGKN